MRLVLEVKQPQPCSCRASFGKTGEPVESTVMIHLIVVSDAFGRESKSITPISASATIMRMEYGRVASVF